MALHIRDNETDKLVRQLAEMKNVGLTDAIKIAVSNEISRASLIERIKPLQARLAAMPNSGLPADKAFYDSLNDE